MANDIPLRISTFLNESEICRHLDAIRRIPNAPIKLAFYAIDERYNFQEIFEAWKPQEYEKASMEIISESNKYVLYNVQLELPEKFLKTCPLCNNKFYESDNYKDKEILYLLRIKEMPFLIVISNSFYYESKYAFGLFNKYYPFLTRILLRAQQLQKILTLIENASKLGDNIYSVQYILKRISEGKETETHFKRKDIKSIFEEARKRRYWLDNIQLKVDDKGKIQLSRDGKIQYYEDFVFSNLLPIIDLIIDTYLISYERFKQIRECRSKGELDSIKIVLDESTFNEVKVIDQFLEYLNKYENSSLTMLSTNGHFVELSLIEYQTGASYDICIYDEKIITIIPQFQNSIVSMINLVSYILEEYDGQIE